MARPRARAPLNVFLNSRLVGSLTRQPSGAIEFRYDPEWLAWEHAIPVSLSLPLRERHYAGDPVVAVFDNLLPDNRDIRRAIAARTQAEGDDAHSLLSRIGRDCVGALQFLPDDETPGPAGAVDGRPVDARAIADILRHLATAPLGAGCDGGFRISIAGVQEKTALLRVDGAWMIPQGTTATTHILKPAIGRRPDGLDLSQSVENEHLCLRLTEAMGLPGARSEIADFAGHRVLVVERFDRLWTPDGRLLRLPQEDLCQALSIPPERKYETEGGPGIRPIVERLGASDDPEGDRRRFLKAQAVFWLLGATDGHAKNFSVFLSPAGRFRMTPLYDVMSTQPNVDAGQIPRNRYRLAMAIGAKRHYRIDEIMPRHFRQTAAKCGLPPSMMEEVIADLVATVPGALDAAQRDLPPDFPTDIADSVIRGVLTRLKTLEADAAIG